MRTLSISLLLLAPCLVFAQTFNPIPEFQNLKYRSIGPAAGGRVSRACGVAGDPLTYYVATAGGGVWKSTDGGVKFSPIFDETNVASIGSIAVAPSDPNVVYVGTGEANIRGNVQVGEGIFKSTDAGKTWKHVWKQVGQIGQIVVHPTNADIAYAAVLGHAFGPNPERGIYRTKNGGQTWEKILYVDEQTGASDITLDPNNPRVLLAGMWPTRRRPWEMTSGGPGGGLHLSTDGGDTWEKLGPSKKKDGKGNGLPDGPYGRIGVTISPVDGKKMYALIEAEKGGLYRTMDGGETWELATDNRLLRQRPWYFSVIKAHPTQAETLFVCNVRLHKSTDSGSHFSEVKGPSHVDHHDLWIDPKNPKRMINANDGGVDITTDGGKTWRAPPLPICQFYHVACDNATPYRVMGCMQDMGSASGPSNSLNHDGVRLADWTTVGGGEAGYAVPDPSDPNIIYAGEYGGYISRYDRRTRQARHVGIYPYDPSGIAPSELKYRFQWTSPILISRDDPKTIYHAANVIFRSRDGGQTWDKITQDLTKNDKNKQKWSGGPITGDNTGVEVYCTIFALAESPKNKRILWVGTDDGYVQISKDEGFFWENVTPNIPDMPDWGTVCCIEPSYFDENTAYVVVDNHRMNDLKSYIWKTTDQGLTWHPITLGLPKDEYALVIREDPKKKGLLYLGTSKGVYLSTDGGKGWRPFRLNMPPVACTDLVVKENDLVVGTHGRSIWILDDLTPVRQWNPMIRQKESHVFPPAQATRWRYDSSITAHLATAAGENPPEGAIIYYYLKNSPKKPIVIEIKNSEGKIVNRFEGEPEGAMSEKKESDKKESDKKEAEDEEDEKPEVPTKKGVNRFVWNLRHAGATKIKKAQIDMGNPAVGPLVAPGRYSVEITIEGQKQIVSLEVKADPRVTEPVAITKGGKTPEYLSVPPRMADEKTIQENANVPWIKRMGIQERINDELTEQEQFVLSLRDRVNQLTQTVETLRLVRKQLLMQEELLAKEKEAKIKALLKQNKAIQKKLDDLEAKLHNPKAEVNYDILAQKGGAKLYSQLSSLIDFAKDGDGPPTQGMKLLAKELFEEFDKLVQDWESLKKEDVGKLNDLSKGIGAPSIWLPKSEVPAQKMK
jgi:photosystem II stability/assembly factor-like uncharacterized protein